MAAFVLTGAKLSDIWHRRRAFGIGLAVYEFVPNDRPKPNITYFDRLVGYRGARGGARDPSDRSTHRSNYAGRERGPNTCSCSRLKSCTSKGPCITQME